MKKRFIVIVALFSAPRLRPPAFAKKRQSLPAPQQASPSNLLLPCKRESQTLTSIQARSRAKRNVRRLAGH